MLTDYPPPVVRTYRLYTRTPVLTPLEVGATYPVVAMGPGAEWPTKELLPVRKEKTVISYLLSRATEFDYRGMLMMAGIMARTIGLRSK